MTGELTFVFDTDHKTCSDGKHDADTLAQESGGAQQTWHFDALEICFHLRVNVCVGMYLYMYIYIYIYI